MKSDHLLINKYTATITIEESATYLIIGWAWECIKKLNSSAVCFSYCGSWPMDGLSNEFGGSQTTLKKKKKETD